VVPTLTFERLFAFLVLGHGRRQLLWFEVTRHPTAEWLACQITEAFPWASAPTYLIRDNDRAYGHTFTSRVQAMGHPRPTDLASLALAKSVRRASDWHGASRVRSPPEVQTELSHEIHYHSCHTSPGRKARKRSAGIPVFAKASARAMSGASIASSVS
jgi:hypothetical protein